MKLTFGICSTYSNIPQLAEMVGSISALNIPEYEILIAGSYGTEEIPTFPNVRHVLTDGWLPKKKNLIAKFATYDTLVMAHDYYTFDLGWYDAYKNFTEEWDVCSNPQYLITGSRHATDWITWDHPTLGRYYSLPYDDWSHTRYQYISGGYYLVRRELLQKYPMNEYMLPGSPEDVEWSLRIRTNAKIVCNPNAKVIHNKRHRDVGNKSFPFFSGVCIHGE